MISIPLREHNNVFDFDFYQIIGESVFYSKFSNKISHIGSYIYETYKEELQWLHNNCNHFELESILYNEIKWTTSISRTYIVHIKFQKEDDALLYRLRWL